MILGRRRFAGSTPLSSCALFTVLLLSAIFLTADGRKCTCTSKACKEAGVDTCRTKFSCYTELIPTANRGVGETATSRGCTEGPTPLLCETKVTRSKAATRMPWPRLRCCDAYDYCNAEDPVATSSSGPTEGPVEPEEPEKKSQGEKRTPDRSDSNTLERGSHPNAMRSILSPDSVGGDSGSDIGGDDETLLRRWRRRPATVGPLLVAALVLAVAAFVSVLAACYVITRFLRDEPHVVDRRAVSTAPGSSSEPSSRPLSE